MPDVRLYYDRYDNCLRTNDGDRVVNVMVLDFHAAVEPVVIQTFGGQSTSIAPDPVYTGHIQWVPGSMATCGQDALGMVETKPDTLFRPVQRKEATT